METLTKEKIAEVINEKIGLSSKDALSIVGDIIDGMKLLLLQDSLLKISSFGTFKVCEKKERMGRNFKTSEKVLIPQHKTISFRPSIVVKEAINGNKL